MDDEYLDLFISELEENIKMLNDSLLELEKDMRNTAPLEVVVRAAHTVKGMAGTMGYDNLTRLTHKTESKLREIQAENKVTKGLIQGLFQVADRMEQILNKLIDTGDTTGVDVDDLIAFLDNFDITAEVRAASEEDQLKIGKKYSVSVKFTRGTALKGARGFQLLRILDRIASIESSVPAREIIEDGKLVDDPTFEIITNEDEFLLRKELTTVADVESIEINELFDEQVPQMSAVKIQRGIQSVRVNLHQLDEVVDLLGELVLAKSRLENSMGTKITPEALEQINNFEGIINTIQERLMKLRMVNLSRIFENYPRTVRDIATQRGLEINVLLQGTHLELDRSVIDQVNEALLHLIRNAAIHGIEDENIRKKRKKPKIGTIRISATQDRGEVVFNVEDDGAGLDIQSIKEKAIEKGIITGDEPLTRAQLAGLIFHPGFSTAKEVTTAAGRGVGMEIVKNTIEGINGSIEIRTKKDTGTLFVIRVPQTLAIIQALVIRVNEYLFTLPLLNIEQIFHADDPRIEYASSEAYMHLGSTAIPIIDLETNLDLPEHMKKFYKGRQFKKKLKSKIILWERGGYKICIKVTDILEQREIVTKPLDKLSESYYGFSGATILDEDQVVLILDPSTLSAIVRQSNLSLEQYR